MSRFNGWLFSFLIVSLIDVSDERKINDSPIIGILAQDVYRAVPGRTSYIAASYVKYLESAGARVVPVMINRTEEEYTKLFKSINGILIPGGGASIFTSSYAKTGAIFYKLALEANLKGDYFPVWGTCLGYELLALLTCGKSLLTNTDTREIALPLNFTKESKDGRIFKDFPEDLIKSMSTENIAAHSHQFSISTESFNGEEKLKNFFRILNTNSDGKIEFVSTVEAYDFPIYGTQWHPEKNPFEFTEVFIPHIHTAVRTSFYMSQFFVSEARKSLHAFPSIREEQDALIYNYLPTYTGNVSIFEQKYFFG